MTNYIEIYRGSRVHLLRYAEGLGELGRARGVRPGRRRRKPWVRERREPRVVILGEPRRGRPRLSGRFPRRLPPATGPLLSGRFCLLLRLF